ncbi:aminoglycoside 3'-phosphotransferase [Actinomadura sp. SCN-SB]|uniref:aminoglycoside 3'-phosphotransferase n=1 Tax=Actinomadura sp. SCN-SB TaxID=3373092 RepID=UPI003750883D
MTGESSAAEVRVPPAVRAAAHGRAIRVVWVNEIGGITFQLGQGRGRRFAKWAPVGSGIDLTAEAARTAWAVQFVSVPQILRQGADEEGSWLVTAGLPGRNTIADRWRRHPAAAVQAIGSGLPAFHDGLPVAGCPFSWSAIDRLADARRRAPAGLIDPARWDPEHQAIGSLEEVLDLLTDPPPIGKLVVCHGDTCSLNTLLTDDGCVSGHVDLGLLGIADRWADLAIAAWSTRWNYGPGWEQPLLDAYGISNDPHRIRYHRLLWELDP